MYTYMCVLTHTPSQIYTHTLIRCMFLAVGLDICLSVVKMCQTGSSLPSPGQAPHNTSQTSLYLSRSLSVLHQPSLSLHLSFPDAVSSFLYLWLQMQPSSGSAACSTSYFFHSASVSVTHFSHNPLVCSRFFLFCTIIPFSLPYVSCPLVPFLTLPVLTSFSSYLALLSLSPSVLSTSQQSPGVKTCWHPLVWQVRLCVCMCSEEGVAYYIVGSCRICGLEHSCCVGSIWNVT